MNICLFSENEINAPLSLQDERAKHIIKILHKTAGETFDAGIIGGQAGTATIKEITETGILFDFVPKTDGKPLNPLSLIIGFPRPIQLRRLLRDVAGLGARRVILCGTELTEKSYLECNDIKDGSALKMLLDGTIQAASTHIPELIVCKSLKEAIEIEDQSANIQGGGSLPLSPTAAQDASFSATLSAGDSLNALSPATPPVVLKLGLDNKKPKMSLHQCLAEFCSLSSTDNTNVSIVAAIGAERGWTDRERGLLESRGFSLCSMGNRVLRTETAVTVASSIILDAIGVLG